MALLLIGGFVVLALVLLVLFVRVGGRGLETLEHEPARRTRC